MAYSIFYSHQAEKYLSRLTPSKTSSVFKRLEYLAKDPFKPDNNIAKLVGTSSSYRLRVGDIRIIYQVDTASKSIYIYKIASRGSAYS